MAEPIDIGSPRWWVDQLERELANRQAHMRLMDDYYTGNHPLPFVTKAHDAKMRDEFRGLLEDARSNFMRLVIDAVEERLRVEGFRRTVEGEEVTDREALAIWQANQMDAESQVAFIEALVKGVSYLSVWVGDDGEPTIAVEDPEQTIVAYEPGTNYRRRLAALKLWVDEWTGERRANLYLPDGIYKFRRKDAEPVGVVLPWNVRPEGGWEFVEGEAFVPNPIGEVPIVPLRNRPRLLVEGESEISDVTDIQDRINAMLFLRCLAGYFGAHRQRWAVGLTLHENERTGEPEEPFDIAVDKLIVAEDTNVRFGEWSATPLDGYIKATEQDAQHIAVVTRTPRHYLLPEGQEPSGDSQRAAEAGLTKKVARKQRTYGEGIAEAIRLARLFGGESDAPAPEIRWADPEIRTEAEITDATIKQYQAGLIPREAALEKLGYSQTQISRFLEALGNEPAGESEQPEAAAE